MKKLLASLFLLVGLLPAAAQEGSLGYNACGGAAVAQCTLKTTGGLLYSLNVTSLSGTTIIVLYDQNTAAATGTGNTYLKSFTTGATSTVSLSYIPMALTFFNGLVVACISAGTPINVTTIGGSCLISGETR